MEWKSKFFFLSVSLTLFRQGFFWSSGTRGWGGVGRGGGGLIWPPPLNSENIKALTTKLGGRIIHPKVFPLRSATSGSKMVAILDPPSWIFFIFPEPLKLTKK